MQYFCVQVTTLPTNGDKGLKSHLRKCVLSKGWSRSKHGFQYVRPQTLGPPPMYFRPTFYGYMLWSRQYFLIIRHYFIHLQQYFSGNFWRLMLKLHTVTLRNPSELSYNGPVVCRYYEHAVDIKFLQTILEWQVLVKKNETVTNHSKKFPIYNVIYIVWNLTAKTILLRGKWWK